MNQSNTDSAWLYMAALFAVGMALLFTFDYLRGRRDRPQLEYAPLPARKPKLADDGVPWYLKFLYARGKFSPRLLAAWLTAGYTIRVIEHWLAVKPTVLNGVLVTGSSEFFGLAGLLVGAIISLFTMGTVQTAVLGDIAPAPGAGNADAKPDPKPQE